MSYPRFALVFLSSTALLWSLSCKSVSSKDGPAKAGEGVEKSTDKDSSHKKDSDSTTESTPTETPQPAAMKTVPVAPGELSDTVKKGLTYLVNQQQDNGGWGQGGGWRTLTGHSGRIQEGNEGYQEQPDVGNTAMATLALLRSGSSPKDGPYAKQIAGGVDYICSSIEASDDDSLFVTATRGTQLQTKIGVYADTFLSALVLSEIKGHMPTEKANKRLDACLAKNIAKIEKNQKEDGTFAGNQGWASVLSQGLSAKSLNRARQFGVEVSDEAIGRVQDQVNRSYDMKAKKFHRSRRFKPWTLFAQADTKKVKKDSGSDTTSDTTSVEAKRGGSNAGVGIYSNSANLAGMAETVKTNQKIEFEAQQVLADPAAPAPAKAKAREDLKRAAEAKEYYKAARQTVVEQLDNPNFVAGFGSSGGEEYLSYMNIGETLAAEGGEPWEKWSASVEKQLAKVQNEDGSWSGHHCITGRTFVTSAALLTLMADRAPVAQAVASAD